MDSTKVQPHRVRYEVRLLLLLLRDDAPAAADGPREQRLEDDEEELARHGAAVDARLADERDAELAAAHQLHRRLVVQREQAVDERL